MSDHDISLLFFHRKQIDTVSVSDHCMCFILRRCQNVAGIRIIASISLICSKKVSADCPYFRFRSEYVPINIEHLSNCCRHKKDCVNFTNHFFYLIFGGFFTIWPNCALVGRTLPRGSGQKRQFIPAILRKYALLLLA